MSVLIRAGILALGAVLLIPSGSARGEAAPQETLLLVVEAPSAKETITVLRDGDAQEEDFETYLTQVVLSEMPADFATEALKAQAVAARSIPNYRTLEAFMDALDKRFHISERHDSGVLVANMIDGSVNAAVRVLRGEFSGDDRTLNTIYQTVIQPLFSVLGLRI